jgi:hypothetical protein
MFTKRHEQELAEIKSLIIEVGQSFQQLLERLERIQETQDQLAADQPSPSDESKAGPAVVQVLDGTPETESAGSKKARRRQSRTAAATGSGPKSGKRRARSGGAARGSAEDTAGDAPAGDGAGRRRGAGAKRRQPAELASSSGSEEE